ncbi:MAG TPA: ATP-binding protein, partial [Candidatus Rifleibacterium sp.]|nr:ATP-binding protein [Candidatus Rifleibacterium sp.]
KISISAKADVSGGYLTVTNNGPQIVEETLAGLFVPGNTTKADGFGLGLYNCQRICVAHGGKITVNSAAAETAFEIYLPLEKAV